MPGQRKHSGHLKMSYPGRTGSSVALPPLFRLVKSASFPISSSNSGSILVDRVSGVLSFGFGYSPVDEVLDVLTPSSGSFPVGNSPNEFMFELGSRPSRMLFFQFDFERVELSKLFKPDNSMESNPTHWTREGWWICPRGVPIGTVWARARKHEKCVMRQQQSMRSTSSSNMYGSWQIVQMSPGSVKLVRIW